MSRGKCNNHLHLVLSFPLRGFWCTGLLSHHGSLTFTFFYCISKAEFSWGAGLLFRGSSIVWRNRLMQTSWSPTGAIAGSCIWEGTAPCNNIGWGLFGSNSAEKDLGVLMDNLSQQCALAAKVANSVLSCINKRAREVIFHKTSSEYCVQFWAPSTTRTILTYGRESIRRPPKQSGAGEHNAHEEAERAGHLQLGEENAKRRLCCCPQLRDCRTGLEDGTSLFSEVHGDNTRGNGHKLQHGKFRIPHKRGKK